MITIKFNSVGLLKKIQEIKIPQLAIKKKFFSFFHLMQDRVYTV